jgi:hypothetical protein
LKPPEAIQQCLNPLINDRLQTPDCAFGKERIDSCSPDTVGVVIGSPEHGFGKAKLSRIPTPPMATLSGSRVQLLVEIGLGNVQLMGIDADNWPVFHVHPTNLKSILPALYYIVIEFIPFIRQRNPWRKSYYFIYQKLTAASLGPGKLAMGLKYRR